MRNVTSETKVGGTQAAAPVSGGLITRSKSSVSIVFLIAVAVFTNLDGLAFGRYSLVRLLDHHDIYFSKMKTMGEMFFKYGFTAWNPYIVAGIPNYAGSLHPSFLLTPLAALLPSWLVSAILNILLYCAILIGTYLYLRDIVGLDNLVSFAGGSFHLLAYFVSNVNVFTTWGNLLPLMLVCTYRLAGSHYRKVPYIMILVLIFSALYPPYAIPFMPVFHLAFIIVHFRRAGLPKYLAVFALTWTGFLAFHAPDLYSIWSMIGLGHRQSFSLFGTPLLTTISVLLKGPGHVVYPLLFLVPFAFVRPEKRRVAYFTLISTITVLAIFIINYSNLYDRLAAYVPALKQFSMYRFDVVASFLFAVLAAIGLQNLLGKTRIFGLQKNLAVIISLLIFMGLTFLIGNSQWPLYAATSIFLALAILSLEKKKRRLTYFALFLLLSFLFAKADFHLREKHASYISLFDIPKPPASKIKEPFRTVSLLNVNNRNAMFPAQSNLKGMESIDGMEMVYYLTFKRFWTATVSNRYDLESLNKLVDFTGWGNRVSAVSLDGRLRFNLNLLAMSNVKFIYSSIPLEQRDDIKLIYARQTVNPSIMYKKDFLSALRSLDIKESYYVIEQLIKKWTSRPTVYLYEIKPAFARTWLAPTWMVKSDTEILKLLSRASINELKETAFIAGDPSPALNTTFKGLASNYRGEAKITKYSPDVIGIKVETNRPAVMVVGNNFDKKWQATVDGRRTPVLRTNYTFQGVLVPKGKHSVEMSFTDPLLKRLLWLFPLWLIVVLILVKMQSIKRLKAFELAESAT